MAAIMANSSLTKNQRAGIAKMHPDVRARATAFFEASNRLGMGLKIDVANTFRTAAQQKALRSTIAGKAAKKSWHQFGFAVDVYSDNLATKPAADDPGWAAVHALAKEFGFKAGHIPGDFGHIEGSLGLKKGELKDTDGDGYPDLSPLQYKSVTQPGWTPPTPTARPSPPAATPAPPALSVADQKLANAQIAYGASRAMNMQPPSMSPPNPGSIRGLNVPSAISRPSAPPSNFSVPDRPSPIGSAPVGQVTRAPLGPALNRPSPPGNFAQGAPVSYAAPKANRLGGMDYAVAPERFDRAALSPPNAGALRNSPVNSNSPPNPGALRNAPVSSNSPPNAGSLRNAPVTSNSPPNPGALRNAPVASNSPPNPGALRGSIPSAPSQAAVMGALSQRAGLEAIKDDSLVGPVTAPAVTVNHPPNPTVGLPVAAPPITRPTVLTNYPVANIPAAQNIGPPRENFAYAAPTASDVYSGKASVGYDSVGNRVSSIPGGTSVTNRYGATTGMMNGYQAAVGSGSMPSIPGMSMPSKSTIGGAVKGGLVGAGVAGPVGGVIGALAGALAAKAMADRKGTTGAATGQSSGGLGGFLGSIFGGSTASKSGASPSKSSGTSSKSSSVGSYGASGSGSYGSNPNSKSPRI